jgi:hypothetical protein
MKQNFDIKLIIIIFLCLALGVISGLYFGSSKRSASPVPYVSSDDAKTGKDYKSKSIQPVFVENATDIQTCYLTYLKGNPEVSEGKVNLVFKINEDGSVSDAKVIKNEFNDRMGDCLVGKVESYFFSPPPYGMNPYMNHSFSFVSEETAKKEAEQRQLNNTPPKILPAN